jgi:hypothetical protein
MSWVAGLSVLAGLVSVIVALPDPLMDVGLVVLALVLASRRKGV